MRVSRFSLALVGAAVAVYACGGSNDAPMSPSRAGATLNVMLTDSPFSDARSLLVTFSEVTAHRSGAGGFTPVPFAAGATSRTCDLKKLTDAQDVLGTGPLPAGHYTQIRLVVSSAALYFDNAAEGPACAPAVAAPAGRSEQIEIPSGEVRLNRQFDVPESGVTTMVLDFDGDQSVRAMGNGRYRMSPVITVVSVQ
jgi:hypothetical protein